MICNIVLEGTNSLTSLSAVDRFQEISTKAEAEKGR